MSTGLEGLYMKLIEMDYGTILVDDEDLIRVCLHTWSFTGQIINTEIAGATITIGRFILNYTGILDVDHKDVNPFNNQKSKKKYPNTNGLLKGVTFCPRLNMYRSRIRHNKKLTHLGYFKTELSAGLAYDRAALQAFGEFASLNFPEGL